MKAVALATIFLVSCIASADEVRTGMHIPGWTIETSESLWVGHNGPGNYPVWQLFDNHPETTWCFRGLGYPHPTKREGMELSNEPFIYLMPDKPVEIDEIRLMNGYNKSEKLYYQNSRALEIQIFDHQVWGGRLDLDEKPIRTVTLSDRPGWKSIRLPKRKYEMLTIKVTGIKRGPINDLCLSELMPRDGGRDVIQRPNSFMYTEGQDNYDDGWFMNWNGRHIARFSSEGYLGTYNPAGTLYANGDEN